MTTGTFAALASRRPAAEFAKHRPAPSSAGARGVRHGRIGGALNPSGPGGAGGIGGGSVHEREAPQEVERRRLELVSLRVWVPAGGALRTAFHELYRRAIGGWLMKLYGSLTQQRGACLISEDAHKYISLSVESSTIYLSV